MPKKLKRFLLRYDPPGLGFEVQGPSEETEVVHKDLPPASQITGSEDIYREVDRIIEEDDLLTKKRHRPALIQLLGRLYQVEVKSEDEEDPESPAKSKSSPKAEGPGSLLQEGNQIVLVGLKNDLAVHNGELGVLSKCRHDKHKYEVHVTNSGVDVKVKGTEHLILVAPKFTPLSVNTAVVIRGLRNHTELNGCLGRVVECHEETHRFEVRAIESGQLFRVKQENLVPIDNSFGALLAKENVQPAVNPTPRGLKKDVPTSTTAGVATSTIPTELAASLAPGGEDGEVFEAGSIVELQGLKTAKDYNGQTAEVLSVDRVRSRYEIRLSDGSVKTIRSENVRLVSRPSKQSPRTTLRRKEGATKAADRGK